MATLHPSNPFYQAPVTTPRNNSTSSQTAAKPAAPPRSNSVTYSTYSLGGAFSSAVMFERNITLSPPSDDEIMITTVRITNSFRRASIEGADDLPSRPPRRGFLRRVGSRFSPPAEENKYTAMKMPRRDYKKFFARDRNGNYAGTEPEREWTREDLEREFGQYQDMPLRSIPGGSEYGEGEQTPYV